MLPSNLLRVKISRGQIRPLYVTLDPDSLALAERIIGLYRDSVGKRKGELLDKVKGVEETRSTDYKLVRGLSALLERECAFEAESALDPTQARMAVFEEASRARATTDEETDAVLLKVASKLGIDQGALESTLYSDIEEELIVREFRAIRSPEHLLKSYNLSLTQTLLFKSLRVEFTASANWKNIFRDVKRFGLIYSVEKNDGEGTGSSSSSSASFLVSLDGPLSLFKLTERYGTSVAKLLPQITAADSWRIKAEILVRSRGNRVYSFEADNNELGDTLHEPSLAETGAIEGRASAFDSAVEERFARSFNSHNTGWTLRREPEPLIAGRHVFIPDFSLEKYGKKVYLEVVGFWTPGYLERKVEKLNIVSNSGIDMIIAVDESLACAKLERLKDRALVFYYKKDVPVKPVAEHLKAVETSILRKQAAAFRPESVVLKGDVVSLESIAKSAGIPVESARAALQSFESEGYARVGDSFVLKTRLADVERKLEGVEKLTDALKVIQDSGFREEDGERVLNSVGYSSVWEGMDVAKARISKRS